MIGLVGASITVGLGLLGLFHPRGAARFTSLHPQGLLGIAEIRATYGGFFLALGVSTLLRGTPDHYAVLGFAWLGAATARLLSMALDRSASVKNFGGVLFEGGIAALLLFA